MKKGHQIYLFEGGTTLYIHWLNCENVINKTFCNYFLDFLGHFKPLGSNQMMILTIKTIDIIRMLLSAYWQNEEMIQKEEILVVKVAS